MWSARSSLQTEVVFVARCSQVVAADTYLKSLLAEMAWPSRNARPAPTVTDLSFREYPDYDSVQNPTGKRAFTNSNYRKPALKWTFTSQITPGNTVWSGPRRGDRTKMCRCAETHAPIYAHSVLKLKEKTGQSVVHASFHQWRLPSSATRVMLTRYAVQYT